MSCTYKFCASNYLQIALCFLSLVIGTSLMEWAVLRACVQEEVLVMTVMR